MRCPLLLLLSLLLLLLSLSLVELLSSFFFYQSSLSLPAHSHGDGSPAGHNSYPLDLRITLSDMYQILRQKGRSCRLRVAYAVVENTRTVLHRMPHHSILRHLVHMNRLNLVSSDAHCMRPQPFINIEKLGDGGHCWKQPGLSIGARCIYK